MNSAPQANGRTIRLSSFFVCAISRARIHFPNKTHDPPKISVNHGTGRLVHNQALAHPGGTRKVSWSAPAASQRPDGGARVATQLLKVCDTHHSAKSGNMLLTDQLNQPLNEDRLPRTVVSLSGGLFVDSVQQSSPGRLRHAGSGNRYDWRLPA